MRSAASHLLATLLPSESERPLPADDILTRFVGWVAATGLSLYPAQELPIANSYS